MLLWPVGSKGLHFVVLAHFPLTASRQEEKRDRGGRNTKGMGLLSLFKLKQHGSEKFSWHF